MTETCPRCSHWHRRAQQAEAELCVTAEERSRQGLSIGRRLAGATWHHYKDRAEAAEARLKELEQERDLLAERGDRWTLTAQELDERLAALEQRLRAVVADIRSWRTSGMGGQTAMQLDKWADQIESLLTDVGGSARHPQGGVLTGGRPHRALDSRRRDAEEE